MAYFIGIDTSCYTTSVAAINQDKTIFSFRTMLEVPPGAKGLRQSDAVFQHLKNLPVLLSRLFNEVNDITAVCSAVTPRPAEGSYMPVFVAARSFGHTVASSLGISFYESTHQEGHIAAALLRADVVPEVFLALHVSGGTTEVLEVTKKRDGYRINLLGGTLDISAGQLIDRTGVMMGCSFPSGTELEKLCIPYSESNVPVFVDGLNCSFSGSENRIKQLIQDGLDKGHASYLVFSTIALALAKLIRNACRKTGLNDVVLTGGVVQNGIIHSILDKQFGVENSNIQLYFSPAEYAGDNAAGIAAICQMKYSNSRYENVR